MIHMYYINRILSELTTFISGAAPMLITLLEVAIVRYFPLTLVNKLIIDANYVHKLIFFLGTKSMGDH